MDLFSRRFCKKPNYSLNQALSQVESVARNRDDLEIWYLRKKAENFFFVKYSGFTFPSPMILVKDLGRGSQDIEMSIRWARLNIDDPQRPLIVNHLVDLTKGTPIKALPFNREDNLGSSKRYEHYGIARSFICLPNSRPKDIDSYLDSILVDLRDFHDMNFLKFCELLSQYGLLTRDQEIVLKKAGFSIKNWSAKSS